MLLQTHTQTVSTDLQLAQLTPLAEASNQLAHQLAQ